LVGRINVFYRDSLVGTDVIVLAPLPGRTWIRRLCVTVLSKRAFAGLIPIFNETYFYFVLFSAMVVVTTVASRPHAGR
jgi:hypothetical protein